MARILIVDDAPSFQELARRVLVRRGHQVRQAEDGRQALELMETAQPQLVVLDLAMPILDGLGFLRTLRATPRWRDLPVLVVTGVGGVDELKQAMALGANGLVLKSRFSLRQFLTSIDDALRAAA